MPSPWRSIDEFCFVTTFYAEVTEVVLQNTAAPNRFFANYAITRCHITILSCKFENGGEQQLTVLSMKYASAYASEHVFLRPYGV